MNRYTSRIIASARSLFTAIAICGYLAVSAQGGESSSNSSGASTEMAALPLGADVGWLTELEAAGEKFYDADGNAVEGMSCSRMNAESMPYACACG